MTTVTAERPWFALWSNFERGEGAWQMLHYFAFFGLISLLFRTKSDWRGLAIGQTAIGSLVALYAVGQGAINALMTHYGPESVAGMSAWFISPNMAALSGTLGNPSYLGGYLIFSALFAIYLMKTEPDTAWRYVWISSLILQAIMFFTAKTRGAFVATGAGIVIALFTWALQKKKKARYNALIFIGAGGIIAATALLVLTIKGDAIKSLEPRLWTWGSAASGVIERPMLGWGTENFPFVFDKYYNPNHFGIQSWFDRAHSAIIEYATSGGLPLAAAYLAIFAVLYMTLWKNVRDGWRPLFLAMPAIYLVNGLVLFEILPLYIMLCLMTAFLSRYAEGFEADSRHAGRNGGFDGASHAVALTAWCAIGISLAMTSYAPLKKNWLVTEALRANGKTDDQVFAEYDAALAYPSPTGTEEAAQNLYAFTVAYFEYLKANDLLSKVGSEKVRKIMAHNKEWHDKVAPGDVGLKGEYAYITSLIAVTQITGSKEWLPETKALIAQAEETAPTRPELVRLHMAAAALERDADDYAKARKKGLTLRPDEEWEAAMGEFKY